MVSFRLSDEEYEQFHRLCAEQGDRSISEIARFAIEHLITNGVALPGAQLEQRVTEIDNRLSELGRKIDTITFQMGLAK